MDYVDLIQNVTEELAEIIDEYIGPYCTVCGQTFIKKFNVRTIHEGKYEYNKCIDNKNCINIIEKKSKKNPWRSSGGF
jgi:hypothetical protein